MEYESVTSQLLLLQLKVLKETFLSQGPTYPKLLYTLHVEIEHGAMS